MPRCSIIIRRGGEVLMDAILDFLIVPRVGEHVVIVVLNPSMSVFQQNHLSKVAGVFYHLSGEEGFAGPHAVVVCDEIAELSDISPEALAGRL